MTRQITIVQFLTDLQIAEVVMLWDNKETTQQFHRDVVAMVLQPNIEEINLKLGQENDPNYLAYAIEYVMTGEDKFSGG